MMNLHSLQIFSIILILQLVISSECRARLGRNLDVVKDTKNQLVDSNPSSEQESATDGGTSVRLRKLLERDLRKLKNAIRREVSQELAEGNLSPQRVFLNVAESNEKKKWWNHLSDYLQEHFLPVVTVVLQQGLKAVLVAAATG